MGINDIQLTVAANVLPMRDTVHDLWFANEFAVDAEVSDGNIERMTIANMMDFKQDGYRIYTFTEAATKAGLPERLSLPEEAVSSHLHDIHLREHLMHTLLLRVNGGAIHRVWNVDGDISEWYNGEEPQVEAVTDAMTELQISKDDGM